MPFLYIGSTINFLSDALQNKGCDTIRYNNNHCPPTLKMSQKIIINHCNISLTLTFKKYLSNVAES